MIPRTTIPRLALLSVLCAGCAVGLKKHPLNAQQQGALTSRPAPAQTEALDGMTTMLVSVPIDAPVDKVWHQLAERYGDVHKWSGPIEESGFEGDDVSGGLDCVRSCKLADSSPVGGGKSFTETILAWDPERHYFLAGVDDGFYPMKQIAQEFWVDEAAGGSRVTTQFHFNFSFPMGASEKRMSRKLKPQLVRSLLGLKHLVETGNADQAQNGDFLASTYPDVLAANGV